MRHALPVLGWLFYAVVASAVAPIIDQSHIVTNSTGGRIIYAGNSPAQMFTVGSSGLLSQVDVLLNRDAGDIGSLALELWPVVAGDPPVRRPCFPCQSTQRRSDRFDGLRTRRRHRRRTLRLSGRTVCDCSHRDGRYRRAECRVVGWISRLRRRRQVRSVWRLGIRLSVTMTTDFELGLIPPRLQAVCRRWS